LCVFFFRLRSDDLPFFHFGLSVSRIVAHGASHEMDLVLDVNSELYKLRMIFFPILFFADCSYSCSLASDFQPSRQSSSLFLRALCLSLHKQMFVFPALSLVLSLSHTHTILSSFFRWIP
jgi:hypothetical protein